jgi:hypothetical protein
MDIFLNNIDLILTSLIIIISAVILARRGQIELLRDFALSLVIGAEIEYGGGTGVLKKSDVTAKIYAMLPTISKLLISSSTISELIEEAKEKMDSLIEANTDICNIVMNSKSVR